MNGTQPYTVSIADWQSDADAIQAVRHGVFIKEQGIPTALEWDGADSDCRHVLVRDAAGRAIATGRKRGRRIRPATVVVDVSGFTQT